MASLHLRGRITDPQNKIKTRPDSHIRELGVAVVAAVVGAGVLAGTFIGIDTHVDVPSGRVTGSEVTDSAPYEGVLDTSESKSMDTNGVDN